MSRTDPFEKYDGVVFRGTQTPETALNRPLTVTFRSKPDIPMLYFQAEAKVSKRPKRDVLHGWI